MTPYKLYNTWIDLDHVVAVEPTLTGGTGPFGDGLIRITVETIFNGPMKVVVGRYEKIQNGPRFDWKGDEGATQRVNDFVEAWKNRDDNKNKDRRTITDPASWGPR